MSDTTYRDPILPGVPFDRGSLLSGAQAHRRLSWGALLGGVILVVAVQLLLSLLGAGIGLGTVDTTAGTTPTASTLGIGAGVWWVVSSIAALAFGGYAAAWLSGVSRRWDGILHGLITWGVATMLTLWLLTSAIGGLISGGASALGGLASAAGSGIKAAAQPVAQAAGLSPDMIQQQAQAYLQPANPDPAAMSAQDAQKQIATNLVTFAKGGPDAAAAKSRIVAIMAAQQKIPTDQAQKQFDDAQAKLQQAKAQAAQEAKVVADASAAAASKTSFAAFVDLLIGAIAAGLGGAFAVQRRATLRAVD